MMNKFRIFTNFDNEEAWLNRMAAEGRVLTKSGPRYRFAQAGPNDPTPTIRVDYRPEMSEQDYLDYVSLFEDAGWQLVDGTRKGGPQYFMTGRPGADTEIFSDAVSKAERYQRAITMRSTLLFIVIIAVVIFAQSGALLTPPTEWYLTPDLWEMGGMQFFGAFVFESVFVFFRSILPWLLVAFGVALLWQTVYQFVLLRRGRRLATV